MDLRLSPGGSPAGGGAVLLLMLVSCMGWLLSGSGSGGAVNVSCEPEDSPHRLVASSLPPQPATWKVTPDGAKPAGKCLRLEFSVAPQQATGPLVSTGLLMVNPPWTLQGELKTILPELEKPLGQGGAGRFRLETPKP